jgi:hypothetical protein
MTDDEGKLNRQSQRFDVDWRVRLKCSDWNAAQRVAAANVSRGGLFIATGKPPTIGARVELAIDLPDGSNLVLKGHCIHVRSPEQALATQKSPGFGLKVDEAQLADLVLLEEMARVASTPVAALEQPLPSLLPAAAGAPAAPPATPAPAPREATPLARVRQQSEGGVREVVPSAVRTEQEPEEPDRTPLRGPAPPPPRPPGPPPSPGRRPRRPPRRQRPRRRPPGPPPSDCAAPRPSPSAARRRPSASTSAPATRASRSTRPTACGSSRTTRGAP